MKLLVLATLALSISFAFLQAEDSVVSAEQEIVSNSIKVAVTEIPLLTAKAYGVFDIKTGEVLFSNNATEELPIASVTKLFTARDVLEELALSEEVVITNQDIETEGRSGKLESGQLYKTRELLFPLLLESSNDAATSLGRLVGEINLAGKPLADPSGLSSRNLASVNELEQEVRSMYRSHPYIFDVTTLKEQMGEYTGWVNNSPVYDLPGYKGGKHGYTQEANRTLVAVFSEVSLAGRELGYIILGSENIREDVLSLRKAVESSVTLE